MTASRNHRVNTQSKVISRISVHTVVPFFIQCKLNIMFHFKIPPGLQFASLAKLIKSHSTSHIPLTPVGEGCAALFIKC